MQFSSRGGQRWPNLITYLKLSLCVVIKSILTFHVHACKGVKLRFYLKIYLFTRKTLWLSLSNLQSYPSKINFHLLGLSDEVLFVFVAFIVLAQYQFELKYFKILIRILARLCMIIMHKEDLPSHETCHFLEQNRPMCNGKGSLISKKKI